MLWMCTATSSHRSSQSSCVHGELASLLVKQKETLRASRYQLKLPQRVCHILQHAYVTSNPAHTILALATPLFVRLSYYFRCTSQNTLSKQVTLQEACVNTLHCPSTFSTRFVHVPPVRQPARGRHAVCTLRGCCAGRATACAVACSSNPTETFPQYRTGEILQCTKFNTDTHTLSLTHTHTYANQAQHRITKAEHALYDKQQAAPPQSSTSSGSTTGDVHAGPTSNTVPSVVLRARRLNTTLSAFHNLCMDAVSPFTISVWRIASEESQSQKTLTAQRHALVSSCSRRDASAMPCAHHVQNCGRRERES